MTIGIDRFLTDPAYLGTDFGGPSWTNWRTLLKGAFGDRLTKAEAQTFRDLTDRDPPAKRVKRMWLALGRRSGKDRCAAAIIAYLGCFGGFAKHLARGETATIVCLACDRDQSRIIFGYIKAFFTEIPLLASLLVSAKDDVIRLTNSTEIVIATNNFRAVRGRSIAAVVMDELAFWRDEASANPDVEVFNALQPAMLTLAPAGAMTIAISTTHRASGLLYTQVTKHLGHDAPDDLAVLAPSTTFNPTLLEPDAQAMIEQALAEDYERAAAEYLSVWRTDLSDMFDRALIVAAMDDETIRWPRSNVAYAMAGDASGGRNDSFAAAVGHVEGDQIIVDRLYERRAPFDTEVAMDEVADLAHEYRVANICHDAYGGGLVSSGLRKRGLISHPVSIKVGADNHVVNRSEIYLNALSAFTGGRVRLPKSDRLVHQLISLERRPVAGGHDRVDHPRGTGHHDDLAVAVCALIVTLASRNPLRVTKEHVARASLSPGSIVTYPTDTVPVCTTPEWHAAFPMERMSMSAREQQQRREPPPERRTSLYISPGTLTRSRNPGAWSDRAGIGVDPYRSAAAAWPVGGISIHDTTSK